MARSKLLTDLVSGSTSLENILLRLKVILSDLEDKKITEWLSGELEGYKEETVPSYRILKGSPRGTYIVNNNYHYTDARVPLGSTGTLNDEAIDKLITMKYTDGLNVIQNILSSEDRNNLKMSISTDYCYRISTVNLQILNMSINFSSNQLDGIVSSVKAKLVDIIMMLEKTFENIDALDITSQIDENPQKTQQVIYNLQNIVYGDSTDVEIGNGNKISGSKIGKLFGLGK
ncbi:AbiTii domain-containing protein [Psychrobacillus sp. FSL H8-0487]|uniref:AbiTii domain-containing protein n=1 Tax=Psychrobacillus sp. FSL H8-0487 TaxID=2921391 RepID=UPI0030F9051F